MAGMPLCQPRFFRFQSWKFSYNRSRERGKMGNELEAKVEISVLILEQIGCALELADEFSVSESNMIQMGKIILIIVEGLKAKVDATDCKETN